MVLELIFAIIVLAIIAFITIRVVGSVALGLFLIALVSIVSYLVIGSFPDLKTVPVIGQFFTFIPSTTGQAVAFLQNVFFKIDIIGTGRDSQNNLMVMVANSGSFDLSGFKVFVDNKTVNIINEPKDPLKPKESTAVQTGWKNDFTSVLIETNQTKAIYTKAP